MSLRCSGKPALLIAPDFLWHHWPMKKTLQQVLYRESHKFWKLEPQKAEASKLNRGISLLCPIIEDKDTAEEECISLMSMSAAAADGLNMELSRPCPPLASTKWFHYVQSQVFSECVALRFSIIITPTWFGSVWKMCDRVMHMQGRGEEWPLVPSINGDRWISVLSAPLAITGWWLRLQEQAFWVSEPFATELTAFFPYPTTYPFDSGLWGHVTENVEQWSKAPSYIIKNLRSRRFWSLVRQILYLFTWSDTVIYTAVPHWANGVEALKLTSVVNIGLRQAECGS